MKVVSINLQVPKWVDDFYKERSQRRMVSKSAVIRQTLVDHVERERAQPQVESKKAAL